MRELDLTWHSGVGSTVQLASLLHAGMPRQESLTLKKASVEELGQLRLEAHAGLTQLCMQHCLHMPKDDASVELPWLGALLRLRDLDLKYVVPGAATLLHALPHLAALTRLRLGVCGSACAALPAALVPLRGLQQLAVSCAGTLDFGLANMCGLSRLATVSLLDLRGAQQRRVQLRGLHTLPALVHASLNPEEPEAVRFAAEDMWRCSRLTRLEVGLVALASGAAELPLRPGDLPALRELWAPGGGRVPESLTALTRLTSLDLETSGTARVEVPLSISALTSLRCVDLSECALRTVPPAVAALPFLETLRINYNEFYACDPLPDGPYLKSLACFEMSSCTMHSLPPALAGARTLRRLDLTGNNIRFRKSDLSLLCGMIRLQWLGLKRRKFFSDDDHWDSKSVGVLLRLQRRCPWMSVDVDEDD